MFPVVASGDGPRDGIWRLVNGKGSNPELRITMALTARLLPSGICLVRGPSSWQMHYECKLPLTQKDVRTEKLIYL